MYLRQLLILPTFAALCSSAYAATVISKDSGSWISDAATIWSTGGSPQTGNLAGSADSVEILAGHAIVYTPGSPGIGGTNSGLFASNDFAIGNANSITLKGGVLAHANSTGGWVRIGNFSQGILDIQDGQVYLPVGQVQVGIHGPNARGIILIGDGTGAAGSAVLNLRDIYNPANGTASASGHITELNLGTQQNGTEGVDPTKIGSAGFVTIESDGLLEAANYITTASGNGFTYTNGVTRIGRYAAVDESVFLIKAGGQFNARGHIEIGAGHAVNGTTAKGLLHLDGEGAIMRQYYGSLSIAYNGVGRMIVENGAQYIHYTNALDSVSNVVPGRNNHFIGRDANGVGTLDIRTGGKFIRDAGGAVGDLYIGNSGTGTVTISTGGEFVNLSTNWDWLGVGAGSKGRIYVNEGGIYTSSSSLLVGRDAANGNLAAANGILEVNGGDMNIGDLHLAENGNATFTLNSGTASVNKLSMSRGDGTSLMEIKDGQLTIRGNLFAGGDSETSWDTRTGTAVINQSGGAVTATNAISIGLSAGHTATYNMTGGELRHINSDLTIGEKGTGSLYVGKDARFVDESNTPDAFLFVGRQNGSNGTVIVDGYLEKTNSAAGIRVGHGSDQVGTENNTTGVGLLGGTGTIKAPGSVWIGNHGTITAGTKQSAGLLTIDGGLNLVSTLGASQSTLFVNFDSSFEYGADRLLINGEFNVEGAIIDGTWDPLGETGLESRYWIVVNEDEGQLEANLFSNMLFGSTHSLAQNYMNMGAAGFVNIGGMEFAMFYGADYTSGALFGGNDLMLSAMGSVPEPGISTLLLGGLAALVLRRRRR